MFKGRGAVNMKKRLGIIVNPIAGIGGKAGLKGSDNQELVRKAITQGFQPESPRKAVITLREISVLMPPGEIEIFTGPKEMGENEARLCGFNPKVIGEVIEEETTPADTEMIAQQMLKIGIDLLLFFGGDGTARNIYNAIGTNLVALGIPTGVKMHSAVFATSPRAGAELAVLYLINPHSTIIREMEVMDIDEEAFRDGIVSAKLYGYLKVSYNDNFVQGLKVGGKQTERQSLEGIACDIVERIQKENDHLFIIGPGTTTRGIMEKLKLPFTLLGVDVVYGGKLVAADVNEKKLLELISGQKAKIVVTPIGGQGFIFGRGNQQISAEVFRRVNKENIIIVAPMSKILSLQGRPMRVDTGDNEIDKMLKGYTRVITGYKNEIAYLIG
jgi:predicted polyphosphate/ATP-dependent NAD kinase